MKKMVGCFAAACIGFAAFALDISIGANADFSYFLNSVQISGAGAELKTSLSAKRIGVHGFADFQYGFVSLGGSFSAGGQKEKTSGKDPCTGRSISTEGVDKDKSFQYFDIKLLGKFPFSLGFAKLYPMAGVQLSLNTALKYKGKDVKKSIPDEDKKDLNYYYFLFGMGTDLHITRHLFVRATPVFGIRMNKDTKDKKAKEMCSKVNADYRSNTFLFNVGLGLGYRF